MAVTDQLFDDLLTALTKLNQDTGPACMRAWLECYRRDSESVGKPRDVYATITQLVTWKSVLAIVNGTRTYYLITPAGLGDNTYGTEGGLSSWWDEFLPAYMKAGGRK